MRWRYRKSIRLPGGFRLNLSKSGLGYSWGFKGFRLGRDVRGRMLRAISIPGTGIYSRQYLQVSPSLSKHSDTPHPTLFFVAFLFLIIVFAISPVSAAVLGGLAALLWIASRCLNRPSESTNPVAEQPQATYTAPESHVASPSFAMSPKSASDSRAIPSGPLESVAGARICDIEALAQEVRAVYNLLRNPLKAELRKFRSSGAYDDIFSAELTDLSCRFAALDGTVSAPAAFVFLSIMRGLHPRAYAGLHESYGITFIQQYLQGHPEATTQTIQKPFLLTMTENSDRESGASNGPKLASLMNSVAEQIALSDGPLSVREENALSILRNTLGSRTQPLPVN